MKAQLGDELIVTAAAASSYEERVGIIVGICGHDGAPPYLVHWTSGDYDARISPWPGTRIRHRHEHNDTFKDALALVDGSAPGRLSTVAEKSG